MVLPCSFEVHVHTVCFTCKFICFVVTCMEESSSLVTSLKSSSHCLLCSFRFVILGFLIWRQIHFFHSTRRKKVSLSISWVSYERSLENIIHFLNEFETDLKWSFIKGFKIGIRDTYCHPYVSLANISWLSNGEKNFENKN